MIGKQKTSRKKAHTIAFFLFLLGVLLLFGLGAWWPGIALVVGIPIAIRQYLLAKFFDMTISLTVFTGIFFTQQLHLSSPYYMPVFLITGGCYLFFREFFGGSCVTKAESEEDLNEEIKEESSYKKNE